MVEVHARCTAGINEWLRNRKSRHGRPFWMVEEEGDAAIIALAVPLDRANAYGDMLTVDTGHLEHCPVWPAAVSSPCEERGYRPPVWSEYEEWPRGRYYMIAWPGASSCGQPHKGFQGGGSMDEMTGNLPLALWQPQVRE